MAAATPTVLGQINMAGALYGVGENPQLSASGATPGTYVLAQIGVNTAGMTFFVRQPTWSQLEPSFVTATVAVPGIFKIQEQQSGLTMTGNVLSADTAGLGVYGTAKLGAGLIINVDGDVALDLPYATTTTFGVIKAGSNIKILNPGEEGGDILYREGFRQAIGIMDTEEYGMVRVNPAGLNAAGAFFMDGEILRMNETPTATRDGIAAIKRDANNFGLYVDDINDPKIDMFLAGNFGWGWLANSVFAGGSGLSISSDGTLSWSGGGSYPTASDTVLGRIKIGAGLVIADDGTASLTNLAPATTSTLGTVRLDAGFNVSSGTISTKLASITEVGAYSFTSAFSTSAVTGVQDYVGLRLHRADSSVPGAVAVTGGDLTIASGDIIVGTNIPRRGAANTFTATQVTASVSATLSSSSYTPDFATGNVQIWNNTHGSVTVNAPTGVVNGCVVQLILQKSDNAHTFTFNSAFKFNSTLNTFTSAQALMLSCICLSSSEILVVQGDVINL